MTCLENFVYTVFNLRGEVIVTSGVITDKREFRVADAYRYDQSNTVRWILAHIWRYRAYLIGFMVTIAGSNFLFSATPWLVGLAFDEVLRDSPSREQLSRIVLAILGVVIGQGLVYLGANLSIEFVAKGVERDARDELYLNLLGKSQTFHNRQRVGDIMARATEDIRQLSPMITPGGLLIFDAAMGTINPLLFIAFIRAELLLTPLVYLVVFYFALRRYTRQLNPIAGKMRWQFGIMNAGLTETISGIEVVKSAAQEAQERQKFLTNARSYRNFFVQEGQVQARYLPVLFLGVALTGAFLHALFLFSEGRLSIGDFVAFMGLMGLLRFPTFISIFTFSLVQLGLAGADRILSLMREETELDENEAGHKEAMRGRIVFDKVTFGFGQTPVLKNISFSAEPGQTVAIVGQTGSGKSTLTQLVNRTYDVQAGRVLIDGQDVRDWNLAALRSQISAIEQDIFLFSRTVAENIAFGLGQQTDQIAIERAAHEAQAHDFITGFKDGYETVIGERGVTLSGGQRQRLAIARALLTNPRILILDDSTSAIDSATEDKIQRAIHQVLQGRTTLLITHRLSQIRWADKILVLRQGQVFDQGTHEELMARCELYRRIFVRYEEQ